MVIKCCFKVYYLTKKNYVELKKISTWRNSSITTSTFVCKQYYRATLARFAASIFALFIIIKQIVT